MENFMYTFNAKANTLVNDVHENFLERKKDFFCKLNNNIKECIDIEVLTSLLQSLEAYQLDNFLRYIDIHLFKFKSIYNHCDDSDKEVLFVILSVIYFC